MTNPHSTRHSPSSSIQQQLPFTNEEAIFDDTTTRPSPIPDRPRSGSVRYNRNSLGAAGLSSSYKTPSRSYIHHAGHASQEPVQYSSSGVREQTAELSSSFLSSDTATPRPTTHRPAEQSPSRSSLTTGPSEDHDSNPDRTPRPEAIEERSEPVSPSGDIDAEPSMPEVVITEAQAQDQDQEHDDEDMAGEDTPLLSAERSAAHVKAPISDDGHDADLESQDTTFGRWHRIQIPYQPWRDQVIKAHQIILNPKSWNKEKISRAIVQPVFVSPAVFLGVLLNLLDALSYGIILFPLGEDIFSSMGADGVSMFYVSCIASQIVTSTGSIFRGGVGSEMIEVVPFFHKMCYMIIAHMGTDNPDAVRATVIVSYAMSSILTGLVFFGLGTAKLGTLVNFFPHSILTGCIGGVGIFLFLTGIEVSARLDGNFQFDLVTAQTLVQPTKLMLWLPPLALAIILLVTKRYYDRPWLVPAYYIGITVIFYIITCAVPSIHMDALRDQGWVFDAPAAGVPFYNFYSYYKFPLVDWGAIWKTVPTQLALTFFGILHVPINVPNLALVVQEDNVSVNRELVLHGFSNTLSGCLGSIQNYLVFVNSVLFINTGGDSRLAGFMLALATFGLWVAGPVVIGFVPVMVVGTLIYMLGIDLAMEALVATYGRLRKLEYSTIVCIAVVMGVYDFVVGIAVGIGLACLVYVVQTSQKTAIRAEFTGEIAESTVRRPNRQRRYLKRVGPQIRVVKLGGYLFFGSIVKVEHKVREVIDAEAFAAEPIRFLILDFSHVTGIDFSAAEAFTRMNRILHRRDVTLVLAGVSLSSDVGESLQMVGLFVEDDDEDAIPVPKVFETLNGALEFCENSLLTTLTEKSNRDSLTIPGKTNTPSIDIPSTSPPKQASTTAFSESLASPRRTLLHRAATATLSDPSLPDSSRWRNFKQPLPLLLQTFLDVSPKNEDFWFRAAPFFQRREILQGTILFMAGDEPDGFYILQSGILRADYELDQGGYTESIVAGTTCGELPFFSETQRTSTVVAERDCVAWWLGREGWAEMQEREGEVARELLKVGMKLSAERMGAITSYVLITAS
ncbi:sulfate transporter family-domain-containing protein [Elsinoe ampelina]|uniref:Sulfate transporter family-domain-containing protein n=1 Tax=Elsinoe ampelina TaxID=302913 RepID=A0A6A6GBM9_9PEZI|nr:sulfate transporter family-domain-containing protein [Elsinoe ampelina]